MAFFVDRKEHVSKTLYKSSLFENVEIDPELSHTINCIRLLQNFPGWTLEYVETLMEERPYQVAGIFGVLDADSKIKEQQIIKVRQQAKTGH